MAGGGVTYPALTGWSTTGFPYPHCTHDTRSGDSQSKWDHPLTQGQCDPRGARAICPRRRRLRTRDTGTGLVQTPNTAATAGLSPSWFFESVGPHAVWGRFRRVSCLPQVGVGELPAVEPYFPDAPRGTAQSRRRQEETRSAHINHASL